PPLFKAESIDIKRIEELLSVIEEFARKCLQEKIYLYLARPVPRCMFDDKKWQELRHLMLIKSKCLVGYRGNFASRIVVNPDLSVFGCFNNQKKADNILRFNDLEKLNEFYTNDFKKHISHCILGLAHNCKYFNRGECYGACFAYKKNK
ncbi:MAG: hypothetical protein KKH94_00990, partial [Candidatus Omnitrophica bacterium]|nr:hypothetical protein [Candidatus Omnitrophota bacterium]